MTWEHHHYRLPDKYGGRRWFGVGYAFRVRGFRRDGKCEGENEAVGIYRGMVRELDGLNARPRTSLGMRVGKRLAGGFEQVSGRWGR